MNRLFLGLYLDEDVDVLIAELIRSRGYDIVAACEEGQTRRTDAEQLAYAAAARRALATHNRDDFQRLAQEYFTAGRTHHGIIVMLRRSPYEIARRLLRVLDRATADEMIEQVIII